MDDLPMLMANCSHSLKSATTVHESIARTPSPVTNRKARHDLHEFYKGKKQLPLDLRSKKTQFLDVLFHALVVILRVATSYLEMATSAP